MSSPLAPIGSIKVKLGLLVTASVLVAALVGVLATSSGVPALLAIPVTVALALGITQLLAVGMTSPLREMTEATRRMSGGDYRTRVQTESSDEIGELARAFNQMAAQLATVDREQRELVATVSHELRTPLAALAAVLENLADGVVPADTAQLDAAVAQAQRLGVLVEDLLELSRVDAGVAPLRVAEVGLADLVEAVVADLAPATRGVSFDVDLPAALVVRVDPARLRQLLTNVLDNAARHSPDDGVVRVRSHVSGDRWSLEVLDSGPGIAPGDRERAFERFGTLASADTAATGGTGLGLAIARWVAALHGGTVRFVDPPTGTTGAVLRLELPLQPSNGPSPRPQEATMATHPADAHPTAGQTVTVAPAPVLEPLFGQRWPDVAGSRGGVVAAAAAVGVLAALVLVDRPLGLALFLVLAGAGATVVWAARHRRDPFTLTCLTLAASSTLPILLLDAEWIGVLCVLAGATVMVVGVTRARRLPEFVLAGLAWPLAGLRGLPWAGRSLRGTAGEAARVVATIAWSVLGLVIFGLLFASADAVVANWFDVVLPDVRVDTFVARFFLGAAVAGATLAAAYLALNPPAVDVLGPSRARPTAHRFEWLVPVLIVDAVFAVFVAAQVTVLFGGHDYVQTTTGVTYASYSHQGFGQLTVATLLTLLVVWAAARRVGNGPRDLLGMRISLGLLCALTLVVVGSALYRMHLYQEAYGFTRLRLLVDVFEGWLGLVVVAVAVAGVIRRGAWLSRFALVTGVAALLGLAALNPDAWIARHNLDRYAETGLVDWSYLRNLSADAVPAFDDRSETEVRCGTPRYWDRDGDWLSWNLGRSRGEDRVDNDPESVTVPPPSDCPAGYDERLAGLGP